MKNIEINIGNACNNQCLFCMVDYEDKRNFIGYETIKKEIIKARGQGYDAIGFLGGEFTLHPQALKIVKLCKLLNFKTIHLISNGRKYSDELFLRQLIKNGANRFSVSIHSHLAEVEDRLTQRPGGFAEKIKGLKNLVEFHGQGLLVNPISINFVINKLNYQDILASLKFFYDLGINDFRLNFIWLHGRAKKNEDLFLKYADFLPLTDSIINFAKENKITIAFEGIPPCLIENEEKLDYLGELRDKKTEIVAYNNPEKVREQFNWQERKKNEFKIKQAQCQKCQYDSICDGVWNDYISTYGWDEFNFK